MPVTIASLGHAHDSLVRVLDSSRHTTRRGGTMRQLHRRFAWFGLLLASASVGADQAEVPRGPFQIGCSIGDGACEKDEGPPGGVTVVVSGFRIDTHEVTVLEYRRSAYRNVKRFVSGRAVYGSIGFRCAADL